MSPDISLLNQLGVLLVVATLLVLALLAWFVVTRRSQLRGPSKEVQAMVTDARIEAFERPSSIVAEQIEEMVKQKLSGYPDLSETVIDFGTVADGTLDIWVNKHQYDTIDDIVDERIRNAIRESVDKFNVGSSQL
ncbi:MAG: hypothetical protein JXB07_00570 [Anaerolineae bacterium]|nr:hypothetical protein [Anaerolineae bacterium]